MVNLFQWIHPFLLQYLYDEDEEVRKKKPRRKLTSNAAITRVSQTK